MYAQWNVRGMEDAMTAQKSVIPMNEHGRAITQEEIKPTVLPDLSHFFNSFGPC